MIKPITTNATSFREELAQIDRVKAQAYASKFGPSTDEAVLNYKKKRKIINRTYHAQAAFRTYYLDLVE